MSVNLSNYLANEEEPRTYLREIMQIDGFHIATNGHYAIFQKSDGTRFSKTPDGVLKCLKQFIDEYSSHKESVEYAGLTVPDSEECPRCEGIGKNVICWECRGHCHIEWDTGYNEYWRECKTCDATGTVPHCHECHGEGKKYKPIYIEQCNIHVAYRYFRRFFSLPGFKVIPVKRDEAGKPALFEIENGFVALMPVRDPSCFA